MTDLHDRVMNLTSRSRDLLRRLDPHPSECPVSDSGEHETYGGICHCGWSRDRPHVAGEAVMPDRQELAVWLADIEAAAAGLPDGELSNADDPENDVPTFEAAPLSGVHDETGQPDIDRDGAPFPAGVNRPDYQPFDADDLRSIVLALEAIPTWFPETLAKARAMSGQPDGEVITDAHGDELEHGGPGDFPGQFPEDAS